MPDSTEGNLKEAPDVKWIDVRIRPPEVGQKVIAINTDGETWVEDSWDNEEPLGTMTGWVPWEH